MKTIIVEGRGDFPTDMLRRNRCDPADDESRARIAATFENGGDTGRRRVVLLTEDAHPLEARWRSFGWPVVEEGVEYVPRPYRVALTIHGKDAGAKIVEHQISLENLAAEGPFVGELGRSIRWMVAHDPRLTNQGAYLYNAFYGLYAVTRWRMEDAFRNGSNPDDISGRIAWTPEFDIGIRIS